MLLVHYFAFIPIKGEPSNLSVVLFALFPFVKCTVGNVITTPGLLLLFYFASSAAVNVRYLSRSKFGSSGSDITVEKVASAPSFSRISTCDFSCTERSEVADSTAILIPIERPHGAAADCYQLGLH